MKLCYLVNQYPSVSHSFIRREILALEALGANVRRFSVRKASHLIDKTDQAEALRTTNILERNKMLLVLSWLYFALRRPSRTLRMPFTAWRMTSGQSGRLVRAAAYSLEAAWLARRIKIEGLSHLHAHFGTNSAAVARLAARLANISYSFTIHGPEEFDRFDALDLVGKVTDAAFVVVISSFGRSQASRFLPMTQWPKLQVVRCGLDLSEWRLSDAAPAAEYDLCFVGRLAPQKGLPVLLEALSIATRRSKPFKMIMLGDGELAGWLQDYQATHGLGDIVEWAGPGTDLMVRAAMLKSRVVAVPSFAEGLPVVIMEAFSVGRPVLTTYVAGIPELVDERCGAVVPAGDAVALADAMEKLLSGTAAQHRALGQVGRARVEAQHDIVKNARQLCDLFDQCLAID